MNVKDLKDSISNKFFEFKIQLYSNCIIFEPGTFCIESVEAENFFEK